MQPNNFDRLVSLLITNRCNIIAINLVIHMNIGFA